MLTIVILVFLSTYLSQSSSDWIKVPQINASNMKTLSNTSLSSSSSSSYSSPLPSTSSSRPSSRESIDNLLGFLKNIQRTLTRNTQKSFKNKILLLVNLRDHILFEIKNRINNMWTLDEPSDKQARGYHDSHDMDYPSSAGALLAIAFLTFAVFLIKLVLRLILALRNGQNAFAPIIGRRKREIQYDNEFIKIVEMIENFQDNLSKLSGFGIRAGSHGKGAL